MMKNRFFLGYVLILALFTLLGCGGGGSGHRSGDISSNPEPPGANPPVDGTYYLAVDGDDANDGRSPAAPLKTFARANELAQSGDKVCIKGGRYNEPNIVLYRCGVIWEGYLDKSGHRVVIDCSDRNIDGTYSDTDDGITVRSSHIVLKHLDIYNSPASGLHDHQSTIEGDNNAAHDNYYEDIRSYDNNGKGFYIETNSNTLVNCSAYFNFDYNGAEPSSPGNHGDGFSLNDSAYNNKLIKCISHDNSDDGFDALGSSHNTLIDCIAYNNGSSSGSRIRAPHPWRGTFAGNGCGYKLGYGTANADRTEGYNIAFHCYSFNNATGFTTNGAKGSRVINCTSYMDPTHDSPCIHTSEYTGTGRLIHFESGQYSNSNYFINNIAYPLHTADQVTIGGDSYHIVVMMHSSEGYGDAKQITNSWNIAGLQIRNNDFASGALNPFSGVDNTLINRRLLLQLSSSSRCIDKGSSVSLAALSGDPRPVNLFASIGRTLNDYLKYSGKAPDLGADELGR